MIGSTYLELKPLKTFFYHRNKSFNKESYFICQSISTKYNKTFKFVSRTNFLEEHNIRSSEIWGKRFTDWFTKNFHGCIFSILAVIQHIMGNAPNVVCPRCKKLFYFKGNLAFRFSKLRLTAAELGSKGNFLKTWNSILNVNGNVNVQCS